MLYILQSPFYCVILFRQRAATKKDLEEVCANLLSSHTRYRITLGNSITHLLLFLSSLNEEFLTKISDILLDKFKDQLKQKCVYLKNYYYLLN